MESKEEIDMVVEKIMKGRKNFSDKELQIYINYSEYIERELSRLFTLAEKGKGN
jgi:hypothetical protein